MRHNYILSKNLRKLKKKIWILLKKRILTNLFEWARKLKSNDKKWNLLRNWKELVLVDNFEEVLFSTKKKTIFINNGRIITKSVRTDSACARCSGVRFPQIHTTTTCHITTKNVVFTLFSCTRCDSLIQISITTH